jgi:hypothetical protein
MEKIALNKDLKLAIKQFRGWWDERQEKLDAGKRVKKPLFHYTDVKGLSGILKDQELWFTSVFHLNDPSELAYGIEIALDVLREQKSSDDPNVKIFCKKIEKVIQFDLSRLFGIYTASFSRLRNDLGQWRAYADNGRGVAIGFSPELFRVKIAEKQAPNKTVFVAEVCYDKDHVIEQQREAIGRAVDTIKTVTKKRFFRSQMEGEKFLKEMSDALTVPIFWNAITAKHEAYKNEQETRLLMVNDLRKLAPHIETRTRGPNLIPFVRHSMPIRKLGNIVAIDIGPSASAPETEDAIRSLLLSYRMPLTLEIERSKIPYRAS